jgi:hypothetical protein
LEIALTFCDGVLQISITVGYSMSNTSPILKLFLSRLGELKGPDEKTGREPDTRRV